MDDKVFEKMLGEVKNLSPEQFKALVLSYAGKTGENSKTVWENAVYST